MGDLADDCYRTDEAEQHHDCANHKCYFAPWLQQKRRAERAKARAEAYRKLVDRYGIHDGGCPAWKGGLCSCGFDVAVSADAEICPRCHNLITEWKRWGQATGEVCEDCDAEPSRAGEAAR